MADAIVRVWWFGGGLYKPLGLGHASLELEATTRANQLSNRLYISFGNDNANRWQDDDTAYFPIYGHHAIEVRIPLFQPVNIGIAGLNGDAIRTWWRTVFNGKKYDFVLNNCCDAVAGALKAGGAAHFSPKGKQWLGYTGALTVLNWANELSVRIGGINAEWANRWPRARADIQQAFASVPNNERVHWTQMPSVEEWKRWSYVRIGARKEQVLALDELVAEYSAVRDESLLYFKLAQAAVLKRILHTAVDHLTTKPRSDRRRAVLQLAHAALFRHENL